MKNTKFYILIICSIIIFVMSLINTQPTASSYASLAMIFMIIVIRKSKETMLSKISQFILGAMIVIFTYGLYLRNF